MQLLTPPENVALGEKLILDLLYHNSTGIRTGSHTPRRAIGLARSLRTNAPVGTRGHPDPTSLGSCRETLRRVLWREWRRRRKDIQVVSHCRDSDRSSFGDVHFVVHPPRGTNNRFCERYDIVFYGHARYFRSDGIDPQSFLRKDWVNFAFFWEQVQMIPTNPCDGHQIRHILKVIGSEISVTPRLDLLQSFVDLRTQFLLTIPVLGQLPKCKGQLNDS